MQCKRAAGVAAMAGALSACGGNGTSAAPPPGLVASGAAERSRVVASDSDGEPLLYEVAADKVDIYDQVGQHQPRIGSITGLSAPTGAYVDSRGDLYVANAGLKNILVYHKGQSSPYETLTGGPGFRQVTTDALGTVYATGNVSRGTTVYVFTNGSTTPTSTLTTLRHDVALATDSKGDLFVGDYDYNLESGGVEEFALGSSTPKQLLTGYDFPGGIAVDGNDTLIFCDGGLDDGFSGAIFEFAPPYTGRAIRSAGLFNGIYACAVNRVSNNLWAATYGNTGVILKFDHELDRKDGIATGPRAVGIALDSARLK